MRSLSSSLLSAQKSPSRLPYVEVKVVDRVAAVARLSFSRLYSGSEPDYHHAATMPGDGSLIRARVAPTTYALYRQRVANPGQGSDFGTWEQVSTVSSVSGIAICSRGSRVILFYVSTNQQTIYHQESTDFGATWGSSIVLLTASYPVGWLAAAINPNWVVTLFYTQQATVYAVQRVSGSWGSSSAWTNSVSSLAGLACVYQGDWNLAVAGTDSGDNYKVWTCIYGDGASQSQGTWSALMELTSASSGSSVEFRASSLGFPDVFRLFFVEKYSGSASYNRPFWSHSLSTASFIDNLWREPVPFDLSSSYGLAIAYSSSSVWLSSPSGVWKAPLSPSPTDLSADVLSLSLEDDPFSGRLRVELRNDDGRYNQIGSGSYAVIKKGSEVQVSPGYKTGSGSEVSQGSALWLEGWEYISRAGRASFILHAQGGWSLLRSFRARRQFSWEGGQKSVSQILAFILARSGLELTLQNPSSTLTGLYPTFTVHPGESGFQAVRRLLDMVPDVLFFRGARAYTKNPSASDASDYSYGTSHSIVEGRYVTSAPGVNRVQVFGSGVMGESYDWGEVPLVYDRLRQVHDLNLDTATKVQNRGDAELRRETLLAMGGELLIPVNCGQELYDVVDITDSRAGLSEAKRRVLGMALQYQTRERPRYEQRLLLGGV